MPGWLQLLIVYAVVAACVFYSVATLLPRSARIAATTALARLLLRRRSAGTGTDRLAVLRTALESYANRQAAAGGCGGCGSCAAQPTDTKGTPEPASQPVHWQPRNGR